MSFTFHLNFYFFNQYLPSREITLKSYSILFYDSYSYFNFICSSVCLLMCFSFSILCCFLLFTHEHYLVFGTIFSLMNNCSGRRWRAITYFPKILEIKSQVYLIITTVNLLPFHYCVKQQSAKHLQNIFKFFLSTIWFKSLSI